MKYSKAPIISAIVMVLFLCAVKTSAVAQKSTIETTGDIFLIAVPVSALASTLFTKDGKGSLQFAESFAFNQLLTLGLKELIKKDRPNNGGDNAFPSGHTSTTFQGASFIHARYGFKYAWPGYLLAGFTGFSRINAEKHDGYDVLAGAMVGIGSTLLFTKRFEKKNIALSYAGGNAQHMLRFRYVF